MSMGPGAFRANAPALDVPAMERDLARIPAVTSARVIVEEEELTEVHVVCGPGRSPKLINRDVQSLLAARWGVDIDHRKVSVVQLTDEEIDLTADEPPAEEAAAPQPPPRPPAPAVATTGARVAELSVSVSDDRCEAAITIAIGDRKATGQATGIPTLEGQRRAAAGAALAALTELDSGWTAFAVREVAAIEVGGERAIVATVSGWRDGAERSSVGAATIGALGELRAAAESVLRATQPI